MAESIERVEEKKKMEDYTVEAIRLNKKTTIRIVYDLCPLHPRKEWGDCHIGTIAAWHRDYNLSDNDDIKSPGDFFYTLARRMDRSVEEEEDEKKIARIVKKNYVVLPVYMFDHSGIKLSTAPFSCPWDSGQIGYIYAEKKSALEAMGAAKWTVAVKKRVIRAMEAEIEELSNYVEGNVYGFTVEENGEIEDSCYGFFGSDMVKNGLIDSLPLTPRQQGRVARELGCYKAWNDQRRASKRSATKKEKIIK